MLLCMWSLAFILSTQTEINNTKSNGNDLRKKKLCVFVFVFGGGGVGCECRDRELRVCELSFNTDTSSTLHNRTHS